MFNKYKHKTKHLSIIKVYKNKSKTQNENCLLILYYKWELMIKSNKCLIFITVKKLNPPFCLS